MSRILSVNNYPTTERFERLVRSLTETGAKVSAIDWNESSPKAFGLFDGVVLSGSPDMMSEERIVKKYSPEIAAIVDSDVPILGVCFGHQMIARAFGAPVVQDKENVLRFVKTKVLSADSIFRGLPKSLMLLESRHEIVKSLPEGFELLASSETSPIAGMKHRKRQLYGVQSHPERYSKENPEGSSVLKNFVSLL